MRIQFPLASTVVFIFSFDNCTKPGFGPSFNILFFLVYPHLFRFNISSAPILVTRRWVGYLHIFPHLPAKNVSQETLAFKCLLIPMLLGQHPINKKVIVFFFHKIYCPLMSIKFHPWFRELGPSRKILFILAFYGFVAIFLLLLFTNLRKKKKERAHYHRWN